MQFPLEALYTRTVLAPSRIVANASHAGGVISLKRLIALVLLMRTYPQISFSVIESIQVDVIDFETFRSGKNCSVNTEPIVVANIARTCVASVPSPICYFFIILGIKTKHLARAQTAIPDSAIFRKPVFVRHRPLPSHMKLSCLPVQQKRRRYFRRLQCNG